METLLIRGMDRQRDARNRGITWPPARGMTVHLRGLIGHRCDKTHSAISPKSHHIFTPVRKFEPVLLYSICMTDLGHAHVKLGE